MRSPCIRMIAEGGMSSRPACAGSTLLLASLQSAFSLCLALLMLMQTLFGPGIQC